MKLSITKYKGRIRKFHENEEGIEALQVVLIIAVAAILLVGIFKAVNWAMDYYNKEGKKLRDSTPDNSAEDWGNAG